MVSVVKSVVYRSVQLRISTNGQKYVANVSNFINYDVHLLTVQLADLTENLVERMHYNGPAV
jgi:hypothetical protein